MDVCGTGSQMTSQEATAFIRLVIVAVDSRKRLPSCNSSRNVRMLRRFSCVRLFVTPWTVAHQAPLSTGFFRQEYWSGLPCPPPGDLPDPGIKPVSLMSPALAGVFFTTEPPGKPTSIYQIFIEV